MSNSHFLRPVPCLLMLFMSAAFTSKGQPAPGFSWAQESGSKDYSGVSAIGMDSRGNAYVLGHAGEWYNSQFDWSGHGVWLEKKAPNGQTLWSKLFNGGYPTARSEEHTSEL